MTGRWRLPGPDRLVREVTQGLTDGRSVVLLIPDMPELDGLELVLSRVVARPWHSVDLGEIADRPGTLAQRLHDYLGLSGDALRADVGALVDAEELRGHAIWLKPSRGTAVEAAALGVLLRDFSRSAAARGPRERPVLMCCARLADVEPAPVSDAALLRTWWWGRVGPLDTRVTVDAAMGHPRVIGDLDVVAEVAGHDLDLADELARRYTGDLSADLASLVDVHAFAPWSGVPDVIRMAGDQVVDEPPMDLRPAWSAGAVEWWGDRLVAHVGCVMTQGADALGRLTWRGQVGAVMPFVELGRQRLAHWVFERRAQLRNGWEYRDIQALEAGQLHKLMREHDNLRAATTAFQFATALREARHALAHLEPLSREWLRRNERLIRSATL